MLCGNVEEEGSETDSSGDEDGEENNVHVAEEGAQGDDENEEEGSKDTVSDSGDPKDKAEKM